MDKDILFQGKGKKPKPVPLVDIRHALKKELDCIKGYKKYKKINDLKSFVMPYFDVRKTKTKEEIYKRIENWNEKKCVINVGKLSRGQLTEELNKRGIEVNEKLRGTAPRRTGGNAFKPLQDLTGVKKYATETEQKEIEDTLTNIDDPFDITIRQTDKQGNLTGKSEKLNLRGNQTKFIEKMIYSNNRGGIAFWGVGTGKTVLTVVSIRAYLHYYPEGKVVFIAPSGLLSNLIKTLFLFGLDIRDRRIQYFSFEKYVKSKASCKNALLVIDEAHNLRTEIEFRKESPEELEQAKKDLEAGKDIVRKVKKGGRAWAVIDKCAPHASKVLLLTATPLVNKPYDINNLITMIDGRKLPLPETEFLEIITNKNRATDFLSYRVSHFVRKFEDEDFPERKENFLFTTMTEDETKQYNEVQKLKMGFGESEEIEIDGETYSSAFYSGQRQFINRVGGNKKMKLVAGHIRKDQQSVVYISFVEKGISNFKSLLDKKNIKYRVVSGEEGAVEKQEAVEGYNNREIQVIIISKAGAEGLDLKNTNNLYVIDQPWNEAMREQVVGRGIRFRSHKDLPKEKRFVNVYNVFLIKSNKEVVKGQKTEETFLKQIEKIKDDALFSGIFNTYKVKQSKAKLDELRVIIKELEEKGEKEEARKLLKKLNNAERQVEAQQFITDEDRLKAKKMGVSMTKFYQDVSFQKYATQNIQSKKFDPPLNLSIDLYLYMYSKSKQYVINEFSKFLDGLPNFEAGMSSEEIRIMKIIAQKNPQTRQEKLNIWKKELRAGMVRAGEIITERLRLSNEVLKKITEAEIKDEKKREKLENSFYQQYFTSDEEIEKMYQLSGIKEDKREENILFLEPTAGTGAIIKYFYERETDRIEVKCCEIEPETRKHLKEALKEMGMGEDAIFKENNFLKLGSELQFDYIIMNPPFNLKEWKQQGYKTKIFDIDFIKKAYTLLKEGGKLVSIFYGDHARKGQKGRLGELYNWLESVADKRFNNPKEGEKNSPFLRQTLKWWSGATEKKMSKEAKQKLKGLKVATCVITKKTEDDDEKLFNEINDLIEWGDYEVPKWAKIPHYKPPPIVASVENEVEEEAQEEGIKMDIEEPKEEPKKEIDFLTPRRRRGKEFTEEEKQEQRRKTKEKWNNLFKEKLDEIFEKGDYKTLKKNIDELDKLYEDHDLDNILNSDVKDKYFDYINEMLDIEEQQKKDEEREKQQEKKRKDKEKKKKAPKKKEQPQIDYLTTMKDALKDKSIKFDWLNSRNTLKRILEEKEGQDRIDSLRVMFDNLNKDDYQIIPTFFKNDKPKEEPKPAPKKAPPKKAPEPKKELTAQQRKDISGKEWSIKNLKEELEKSLKRAEQNLKKAITQKKKGTIKKSNYEDLLSSIGLRISGKPTLNDYEDMRGSISKKFKTDDEGLEKLLLEENNKLVKEREKYVKEYQEELKQIEKGTHEETNKLKKDIEEIKNRKENVVMWSDMEKNENKLMKLMENKEDKKEEYGSMFENIIRDIKEGKERIIKEKDKDRREIDLQNLNNYILKKIKLVEERPKGKGLKKMTEEEKEIESIKGGMVEMMRFHSDKKYKELVKTHNPRMYRMLNRF